MDIHEKVLNAFQVEHKEQLQRIRSILGTIEKEAPVSADPRWDEAFRMAHTLKGGARVCDLREMEQLGHRMESLFASVRDGSLEFNQDVAHTIYQALDAIEDWMSALVAHGTPSEPMEALAAIEQTLKQVKSGVARSKDRPAPQTMSTQVNASEAPEVPFSSDTETVRVNTADLDTVLRSADELLALANGHEHMEHELAQLRTMISALVGECEAVRISDAGRLRRLGIDPEFNRIVRHIDSVVQQARRLAKKERHLHSVHQNTAWSFGVLAESLRRDVHRTRMISADNILQGLGSMVRSLARDSGKKIEFAANGLETLADRRVLQALRDPLLHVLRNAVVHGIESPDRREAEKKTPAGTIALTVAARANWLEITVDDDGSGLDQHRIEREAARRGLLPATEVASARDHFTRLLFQPGFSTCDSVSELAGRGMGLSVVQTAVGRLQGTVDIRPGKIHGTRVTIRTPLSISAQRMLFAGLGNVTVAMPAHAIDRLLFVKASEIQTLEGSPVVTVQGAPLPLLFLAETLGLGDRPSKREDRLVSVVILRCDERRVAVAVDSFLAEREALIKELDAVAATAPLFAGAVLMDDGRVALVLDPAQVVDGPSIVAHRTPETAKSRFADRPATILIVDDSFTTRTLEKSILEANGYDVRIAVDGLDALTCLRAEPVDLVIADVEMPRMDGLTLLKEVKADNRLSKIPLILVTSMDRPEDLKRGLSLGADAYIVKRKFDHQELLGTIRKSLKI